MCFRVSVVGAEPVRGLEIHVTSSWLTNRAGGGDPLASGYKIEDAPEDAVCLAARAAAAIDADCSGVDVMEKADGALYVLETDAFAGLGRTAVCRYLGRYVLEIARRKENRASRARKAATKPGPMPRCPPVRISDDGTVSVAAQADTVTNSAGSHILC